jgi:predicted nucleic acid-binding Zn ribbon protein
VVKIPAGAVDARGMSLAAVPPYPLRVQKRHCGRCGKHIARTEYACLRCGKTQRVRRRIILLPVAGALIAGMFIAATISANNPGRATELTPTAAAATPAVAAPRTLTSTPAISAGELQAAYTRDRGAADRLYRNRPVVVSGVVRSADHNYQGGTVVRLETSDSLETVNATLATREDPGLGALAKGSSVSLLCIGRGQLMGAPQLGSCFVR